MTRSIDQELARLLATLERAVDEEFVALSEALIRFDERRRTLRRAALSRVALEALAAGAILVAFAGAARIGDAAAIIPLFSPAMAGLAALCTWCAVSLRSPPSRHATG